MKAEAVTEHHRLNKSEGGNITRIGEVTDETTTF